MVKTENLNLQPPPYGWVDRHGNFEYWLEDWMIEEPGVVWVPVFLNSVPF